MRQEIPEVFVRALELPTGKRAQLAAALLKSLDGDPEADVESAWAEEIEQRAKDHLAGRSKTEDWEVVRDRARQRLRDQ